MWRGGKGEVKKERSGVKREMRGKKGTEEVRTVREGVLRKSLER